MQRKYAAKVAHGLHGGWDYLSKTFHPVTTELANPVIGTSAPAPPHFTKPPYKLNPVNIALNNINSIEHQLAAVDYVEQNSPKTNVWIQMGKAFVMGGLICCLGQLIVNIAGNAALAYANHKRLYFAFLLSRKIFYKIN